ncbi:hypothetical protein WJX75_001665 [Coccomyxa subellipsoidea]|uniref:Uncharacterized protein n=1 Tax=Coccomyxa subellipsoidea TaxID=248742 RepID=A0ABR2Z0I4_9CHLO
MPTQAGSVSISRNASIAPGHEISAAQNTPDALQEASRWLAREAALAAEQQPQPRCKAAAPPQHRNSDLPRVCVYMGPALAKFQEEHRLPAEELRRLEQADADGSLSNGIEGTSVEQRQHKDPEGAHNNSQAVDQGPHAEPSQPQASKGREPRDTDLHAQDLIGLPQPQPPSGPPGPTATLQAWGAYLQNHRQLGSASGQQQAAGRGDAKAGAANLQPLVNVAELNLFTYIMRCGGVLANGWRVRMSKFGRYMCYPPQVAAGGQVAADVDADTTHAADAAPPQHALLPPADARAGTQGPGPSETQASLARREQQGQKRAASPLHSSYLDNHRAEKKQHVEFTAAEAASKHRPDAQPSRDAPPSKAAPGSAVAAVVLECNEVLEEMYDTIFGDVPGQRPAGDVQPEMAAGQKSAESGNAAPMEASSAHPGDERQFESVPEHPRPAASADAEASAEPNEGGLEGEAPADSGAVAERSAASGLLGIKGIQIAEEENGADVHGLIKPSDKLPMEQQLYTSESAGQHLGHVPAGEAAGQEPDDAEPFVGDNAHDPVWQNDVAGQGNTALKAAQQCTLDGMLWLGDQLSEHAATESDRRDSDDMSKSAPDAGWTPSLQLYPSHDASGHGGKHVEGVPSFSNGATRTQPVEHSNKVGEPEVSLEGPPRSASAFICLKKARLDGLPADGKEPDKQPTEHSVQAKKSAPETTRAQPQVQQPSRRPQLHLNEASPTHMQQRRSSPMEPAESCNSSADTNGAGKMGNDHRETSNGVSGTDRVSTHWHDHHISEISEQLAMARATVEYLDAQIEEEAYRHRVARGRLEMQKLLLGSRVANLSAQLNVANYAARGSPN